MVIWLAEGVYFHIVIICFLKQVSAEFKLSELDEDQSKFIEYVNVVREMFEDS